MSSRFGDATREQVISLINEEIKDYQISRKELTFPRKRPVARAPREKGVIRFRHPENGKTWTGIGRTPEWFKAIPNAREVCKV